MSGIRWELVNKAAHEKLEAARDALEAASGDDVPRLQGRIAALREIIQLPETLAEPLTKQIEPEGDLYP